jgi:hypothetical protein
MGTSSQRAIFIIGIEHRSGTNFLSDLLALHADTCRPSAIGEDFFVHHAHHLQRYTAGLHQSWSQPWRESATQGDVAAAIGRGLLSLLADQADRPARHLVTKTPRADRLALFPWLFPGHPLLILVRDGRSVVESAVKSFGWSYDKAIRKWGNGARKILEFVRGNHELPCRSLVVRYEDLVTNNAAEMRRILTFLRLDPAGYDFDAAAAMPVRGSSTLKSQGQGLHWIPVPKSSDFNPLKRGADWPARLNRKFLIAAGMYQQLLGYSVEGANPPGVLGGLFARWLARKWQRRIARMGLAPLERQVVGPRLAEIEADEQPVPLRRAA